MTLEKTDTQPISVAFIGATGRSGSTLVSRVLGSLPGVCSVGELFWIWTHGVLENHLCSCSLRFHDCPFWAAVGSRAYGGWGNVEARAVAALGKTLASDQHVPGLLLGPRRTTKNGIEEYWKVMQPLYQAIRLESGAQMIVDNSKRLGVALLALLNEAW